MKETNESSSIENGDNSPYEEQQLLLRTTKVKKNFSPPIKIGKTKQVLGKTVLGKNKGSRDKENGTNQVFKKTKLRIHMKKIFSLSINANLTLCDP